MYGQAKQLHYWMTFVNNESGCAHEQSQVIVVGSHADVLEGASAELESRWKLAEVIANREMKSQAFVGFMPLTKLERVLITIFRTNI